MLSGCSKGFKPEEIKSIENEIKNNYERREWENVNVTLIQVSDYKLTGNVAGTTTSQNPSVLIRQMFLGSITQYEVSAKCEASKDMNSNKYIWSCK